MCSTNVRNERVKSSFVNMGKEHPNIKRDYKVCFVDKDNKIVHRDKIDYAVRRQLLQDEMQRKLTEDTKKQHFFVQQYADKLKKLIGVPKGLLLLQRPPGQHECWKKRQCYANQGSKFITFGYSENQSGTGLSNTTMFVINKNTGKMYPTTSSKKEIGDIAIKSPEDFWNSVKVVYESDV